MNNQILKLIVAVFIIAGCNKDQKLLTVSIAPKITEITSETTKHLENEVKVCSQFADNMNEFIEDFLGAFPKALRTGNGQLLSFWLNREEVTTLKKRIEDTYHPRHLKIKESFKSKKRAIMANDLFTQLLRLSFDLEPGLYSPEVPRDVRYMKQLHKQIKDVDKKTDIFTAACQRRSLRVEK